MRYRDIEFGWSEDNQKYELVQWQGKTCMVIAFFDKGEEGYDMRTVGQRFMLADKDAAHAVARHAHAFLDEMFELERRREEWES